MWRSEINTAKTATKKLNFKNQAARLLMKIQYKIKQVTQFLISSLRNYQLYIPNFAESNKFIGGDDFVQNYLFKSTTFKIKQLECLIFTYKGYN